MLHNIHRLKEFMSIKSDLKKILEAILSVKKGISKAHRQPSSEKPLPAANGIKKRPAPQPESKQSETVTL